MLKIVVVRKRGDGMMGWGNRNRKVMGGKRVIEEDEERFLGRRGMDSSKGSVLDMRGWAR